MPSRTILETYDYLRRIAPELSRQFREDAARSHNEEEFRIAASQRIAHLAAELGIELATRHEYTLATGRADAVYNRFIIEYENPGVLNASRTHGGTRHAVGQVDGYLKELARTEHHDRLLGAAFDGYYFVFVRYHAGHVTVEEPLSVTPASTERFLRGLFSLASGRALIPENLVEDFGSANTASQEATRALYNALACCVEDASTLPARLFAQWKLFFGQVAGYEAAGGQLAHRQEMHAFTRGMGLDPATTDAPRLFFAIHTYFSFLVKNIARLVLSAYTGGALGAMPLTTVANLQGEALRRELENLERGGIFRALGLKNLLEGDFFSWYLSAWNAELEDALRHVLLRLAEYNPATVQDAPTRTRDLLKKLYHYLLPREIRHDLGEFYTPDWLAERLLSQLNEPLFQMPRPGATPPRPDKRLLDPGCGSGTFLVLAIGPLKANCLQAGLSEGETLEVILNSVMGIDLNPLAVLAARVNYLLAIADLLPSRRHEVEIPVYLADSILTPSRGDSLFEQNRRVLATAVGKLPVPDVINTRAEMERLTDILEEYTRGGFGTSVFLERCRRELPDVAANPDSEAALSELFERLADLHRQGLDGIWARILRNAFMPLFLDQCDYVAGNPPWINWESLPPGYREQSMPLWQEYGLFVHSGMDTILGKGKKDISTLMTYVAADRYLRDGGKLGFVITQSVWKTAGAGQGFRRFRLKQDGAHLRVLHVDDMSCLQVFEGASTRTSVFVLQKGQPTSYPVSYTFWKKTAAGRLDYDSTLEEVTAQTRRLEFFAIPVDAADLTSAWLTARRKALDAVRKVLGQSDYAAHAGVTTWANGVFWLETVEKRPDGLVVMRNVTEGAKREVEQVTVELESDLLYPLLRESDLRRWYARPVLTILMVQDSDTRRGIDELTVQRRWPKTWTYLKRFEAPLRQRSGFLRYFTRQDKRGQVVETGPFYSMFNIGDYTFAPWKVVWPNMGDRLDAAVVSEHEGKVVIPQHIVTVLSLQSSEEAHYVAAVVNSLPFQFSAHSYSQSGGKSFATPQILENVRIPRCTLDNPIHRQLSALSQRAHELAPAARGGDAAAQAELRQVEAQVDVTAASLWGLSDDELAEIRRSLAELG